MSYPSGGYGSGGYGPGGYGSGGPGGPPGPQRSPWASPVVLVAVAAGILLVVGGALAAFLLIPTSSSDTETAASSSSVAPPQRTVTDTVTRAPGGGENPGGVPDPPAAGNDEPTPPRAYPTVPGADWQGFTDGPRCNSSEDPAVMIGQTSLSRVLICQVGEQTGRWYYKGLASSGSIEIAYPTRWGGGYRVTNNGVVYLISPDRLTITESGETLSDEPMLAYWSQG